MGDAVQLRAHAPESVDKKPLLMPVNAMNIKIARGAVTKAARSASVPPRTVVKKVVACATPAGRLLRREDGIRRRSRGRAKKRPQAPLVGVISHK